MDRTLHLRVVAYFVDVHATYSHVQRARTISLARLTAIYNHVVLSEAPDLSQSLTLDDALQLGAHHGFWTVHHDQETGAEILVLA